MKKTFFRFLVCLTCVLFLLACGFPLFVSAADKSTPAVKADTPVQQYQRVQVCGDGVCRTVLVPVSGTLIPDRVTTTYVPQQTLYYSQATQDRRRRLTAGPCSQSRSVMLQYYAAGCVGTAPNSHYGFASGCSGGGVGISAGCSGNGAVTQRRGLFRGRRGQGCN